MEKQIKYTVRITTYNRAYCVLDAVESVLSSVKIAGVCGKTEMIIVDDGSVDNTDQIIHEYIKKHPEFDIRYHKLEKNSGVSVARNEGCRLAKGEWIVDLDSDDKILPEAFSVYESYIEKYPNVEVFAFGAYDSKGNLTVHVKDGEYICKEWKEYFDKGKYYDGEFQHVIKRYIDKEYPFKVLPKNLCLKMP